MITFAAITPHPPIIIPSIGKGKERDVRETQKALDELEQRLYLSKPSRIICISPHVGLFISAFTINAHHSFIGAFERYGDMSTRAQWRGSPHIAAQIAKTARDAHIDIRLMSEEMLDHGASVPLLMLLRHLDIPILPIGFSGMSPKAHLGFGELLKDIFSESPERIAVIASGDLSHTLTTGSPAGFDKVGAQFDAEFIEKLETRNTVGLASIDEDIVSRAKECGYRSTLVLAGMLKDRHYQFENMCYEAPFGIGYLTGQFIL